ncbi:hypothetical protein KQ940_22240 [Marinobacterium sp. D7]|uniref:hypothetical protein n=1 Tax=Marinobacterium ramblicola TaxID=2849041 RepID=UPI001C2D4BC7|nr:hypothetical protein [Marinobacterium ramblicola]MBV1790791.1 hypothetical protein [Marinobacterium ramblicola]
MIETVALIATLLGGVAAIVYFWEKLPLPEFIAREKFAKVPAVPANSAAIFAYCNANQRLVSLTKRIAERRGYEIANFDSESVWLKEKISKMNVETLRELDGYVKKHGGAALRLSDYSTLQGPIDTGIALDEVLDIVLMERLGLEGFQEFHQSLQHSTGGAGWAREMFEAYEQVKSHR